MFLKDFIVYVSVYEWVCKDFLVDFFLLVFVEINEIVFFEDVELLNLF